MSTARQFPKPETTRAILMSEGIVKPTPTVHHYFETRRTSVKIDGGSAIEVWEHLFKCFVTGRTRRWGISNILGIVEDDEPATDTQSDEETN